MSDRRFKNIQIFQDTVKLIEDSQSLQDAIDFSLRSQLLYLEADNVTLPNAKGKSCHTIVSTKRSFEAASVYAKAGKRVCVLNFASATNPGGGVTHGSSAQEESLCRCSTLYPCLNVEEMWQKFYLPHRASANPLYNDDCIYTPGVMVTKTDVSFPERMPESDWYQVDVLTCAAPNLRSIPSNPMNPFAGDKPVNIEMDDLYQLRKKRIEKIFKIAIVNDVEVLILGAFGCGAFCNPPEVVAKAFYDVQKKYEHYFETIEYAVFCGGHETQNYEAFCNVFGVEKIYDLSRFYEAHAEDFRRALEEVKGGHKQSHWMWYIFPQIVGLGHSRTSVFYAISDIGEAKAYMKDPVLGAHMKELCEILLSLNTNDALEVFGWPDHMKLKSSMTLFEKAVPEETIFGKVLDKFFAGERDENTLSLLE